ncbi:hypothetical protein RJ639_044449, partial [Escallonia herrerae]
KALLQPGLPQDFALQTVQEAINPQKHTKLVQDENQLLENILRMLLQELVSAAVQSGEEIMQYGQSVADGESTEGQIPRLLDIVLYLCEKEHVEGGMIFQLLEDLTEMSTMRNCKDVFGYIESKQDTLGKPELFARGKLVMLRTCNQLLRRLSKANDVVFCGRIIMFLAHFFPLSERSAVNIKGVFNTSNETNYEKEAPDGISIDFNFYKTFWSLQVLCCFGSVASLLVTGDVASATASQEYFSNPASLTLAPAKWHKFTSCLMVVLDTFEAQPLSDEEGNANNLEDEASTFSIKYLTSSKLMGLEVTASSLHIRSLLMEDEDLKAEERGLEVSGRNNLRFNVELLTEKAREYGLQRSTAQSWALTLLKDPSFRRHILVQCLILFDYQKEGITVLVMGRFGLFEQVTHSTMLPLLSSSSPHSAPGQAPGKSDKDLPSDTLKEELKTCEDRVKKLLTVTPPKGEEFLRSIEHILERERNWVWWKRDGCPPFEKQPIEKKSLQDGAKKRYVGRAGDWGTKSCLNCGNGQIKTQLHHHFPVSTES